MANPVDLMGALNAYRQSIQAQREQLMQPAPQQGGFLSGADPVMLSLAAGLLSPTKAGSFGESLGAGLSAAAGPLSEIRKQEAARADKLAALNAAEAKMNLDFYEAQQGLGRGASLRDPTLNAKIWGDMATDLETQAFPYRNKPEGSPEKERYNELMNQANFLRKKAASIAGYEEDEEPVSKPKKIPTTEESTQPKKEPAVEGKATEGAMGSALGSGAQIPPKKTETTGKTEAKPYTGKTAPPDYPNAKLSTDGYWYVKQGNGYARVVE